MSFLDLLLGLVIIVSVIRCFFKGFIGELFSFLSILGAVFISVTFYKPLGEYLAAHLLPEKWSNLAAFLGLFFVTLVIVKIVELLLTKVIEKIYLKKINRILGAVIGLAEGVLIGVGIVILLRAQPIIDARGAIDGSFIVKFLDIFIPENIIPVLGSAKQPNV